MHKHVQMFRSPRPRLSKKNCHPRISRCLRFKWPRVTLHNLTINFTIWRETSRTSYGRRPVSPILFTECHSRNRLIYDVIVLLRHSMQHYSVEMFSRTLATIEFIMVRCRLLLIAELSLSCSDLAQCIFDFWGVYWILYFIFFIFSFSCTLCANLW